MHMVLLLQQALAVQAKSTDAGMMEVIGTLEGTYQKTKNSRTMDLIQGTAPLNEKNVLQIYHDQRIGAQQSLD